MCKICKNPTVGWLLWLLVFLFGIQTTVWSQNEKTELNVKDVTVREFFNKIEAQSEYRFTYRDLSVDELQRISYSGRVEPIEALLQEVLTPLNLQFKISRKNVLITRKAASPQQKDAQAKKYSGIVKDNRGEPLIGASVRVKGLTVGTITDVNGAFSIEAAPGSTLEVSYIGYLPVEVMVTERDYISVTLSEDAKMLEEVVVVGYGMQKKENLTGAVSAVDVQKTLEGRAIPDAARGLQGTTPGLTILVPSGEIGSDPIIKIRGQLGSINGGNSPLILLDNVEIPNLSFVNSDDIESISVLKDAASASIYGAKGAFGVVLITTKKGAKTDGAHISYNGTYSWQNAEKYEMGGYEAMEFSWLAIQNTSPGSVKTGAFYMVSEDQLKKAKEWQEQYGGKLGPNDPTIYGRDWEWDGTSKYGYRTYDPYEYLISKNAPAQDHKISITGKAGNTTYAVGLNYLDQTGMNKVAKSDRFVRYSGTVKVTSEINKYLTVNAGAMYSTRQKEWPFTTFGAIDQWYYLYRWGPQYPLGQAPNKNGDLIDVRSPYSEFKQANTGYTRNNYTSFNVGALVNFTDNWTFNFDYAHANTEFRQWWPGTQFTALNSWGAPVQG
ncbi:MAG: carboxypeptidase-like regulatory domain-containing protein, partial [Dysgonamonadaceae bacterium]|nr:carboxypeptidase-like regulatory domain-containing protein [Dysgonamonadaceae bacterium]